VRLITAIALICTLGGMTIIVLGFVLGFGEARLRKRVSEGLERATRQVENAAGGAAQGGNGGGLAAGAQQQGLVLDKVSEYVKNLSEFAKALSGLSQATQAFLVGSILFAMAVALAAADRFA
jgi:hypothetical protein